MVQQVTERAKNLRDKEFKLPNQKPMPCLVDYNACRACYKEHADDILKCAPLTKSYYECVRRAKQQQNSADKQTFLEEKFSSVIHDSNLNVGFDR